MAKKSMKTGRDTSNFASTAQKESSLTSSKSGRDLPGTSTMSPQPRNYAGLERTTNKL